MLWEFIDKDMSTEFQQIAPEQLAAVMKKEPSDSGMEMKGQITAAAGKGGDAASTVLSVGWEVKRPSAS